MSKHKKKKPLLKFIAILLVVGLAVYGAITLSTHADASDPSNLSTTYTWGGSQYHDAEFDFQITVSPDNGTTYDDYSWPVGFTLNTNGHAGGQAQLGYVFNGSDVTALFKIWGPLATTLVVASTFRHRSV